MNKEEFAGILTGRTRINEINKEEQLMAKQHGLVVVFGYSDDGIEFKGAVDDQPGCYGYSDFYFKDGDLLQGQCSADDCPYFEESKKTDFKITAYWDKDGYDWVYETDIPHATFDIYDEGEKYCRGIVFDVSSIKEKKSEHGFLRTDDDGHWYLIPESEIKVFDKINPEHIEDWVHYGQYHLRGRIAGLKVLLEKNGE